MQLNRFLYFLKEKKKIIGLSSLTYRLWEGSVYYIENNIDIVNDQGFLKKIPKTCTYNVSTGISDVCWLNNDSFIIGTDEGMIKEELI